MPSELKTPGVYIEEKNAFPNSVVAVGTAVPVFIGYTQKADYKGESFKNTLYRITSFAEYVEYFGGAFNPKFEVKPAPDNADDDDAVLINAKKWTITSQGPLPLFYNSIRLFYANGGGPCYIYSVGTYDDQDTININIDDFTDDGLFDALEREPEPTLVVMPDVIALGATAYKAYTKILEHCGKTQRRFAIFDIARKSTDPSKTEIEEFRELIGIDNLRYGAAYYPWLKSTVVSVNELGPDNLIVPGGLEKSLPEPKIKAAFADYKNQPNPESYKRLNQTLLTISPTYATLLKKACEKLNELPPSGAIAGIYTRVDNNRGVWKAPANVSVNLVTAPVININSDQQEKLNVDALTGKSINVIRPFPGEGTLVWGGRTLDGNSQDWRYVNVRRTMIMLEQSIKQAAQAYTFQPNTAVTWGTIKSMITNFLTDIWKAGGLAGAKPEDAFIVEVGLGTTMTNNDILDGYMRVSVKLAIVRPAEFIEITFQQQMPNS